MRVAFLVGEFPKLSESFVLNEVAGIRNRGVEVDVYSSSPPSVGVFDPTPPDDMFMHVLYQPEMPAEYFTRARRALNLLMRAPAGSRRHLVKSLHPRFGRRGASLRMFFEIFHWATFGRKRNYDIIHCHFGPFGVAGALIRDLLGLSGRLVTTFHGFDMSRDLQQSPENPYRFLFERGDMFLPVSRYWRDRLVQVGCDPEKTFVHHLGVDCTKFDFVDRKHFLSGPFKVLCLGRLVEKKGFAYAIEAVSQLAQADRQVSLTIAGDGPLRASLASQTVSLGIERNVRFTGPVGPDDVRSLMQNNHVLVAPSVTASDGDQEGIPVVIMEAMATGLPVVSTTHTGIPELVRDEETGFLLPERDSAGIARILTMLDQQRDILEVFGRAGRRRVKQHFNLDRQTDVLVERYEALKMQA